MNAGDQVSWTHVRDRGRSLELMTWEGEIVEITGEQAVVKRHNKRYTLPLKRLRMACARSELTDLVMGKEDRHAT